MHVRSCCGRTGVRDARTIVVFAALARSPMHGGCSHFCTTLAKERLCAHAAQLFCGMHHQERTLAETI